MIRLGQEYFLTNDIHGVICKNHITQVMRYP